MRPPDPWRTEAQRGERVPPPVDAYSPRGDPYRSGGVSSAPDAPQRAGGKELRPLDPSTGATKYAWGKTYPTGDGGPPAGPHGGYHPLAQKESQMMKQIRDAISIVIEARWN